ncbi:hypothetical protein H0H81_006963 [Sphagnurus paluster]|uniref:Chitinase n=1 Tax=Sphagnurus paluster TaxID=117069 RepID=A0A9P7GRY4_9AGAR|nr:hypothetical protein H0H81_006963 [Sphagnurus paluster]
MTTIQHIYITEHTTSSSPNPHILYVVKVVLENGQLHEVLRRYSQFSTLQAYLGDSFNLPPKRVFATAVVPSSWVDDGLIAERKKGLSRYLNYLNATPEFQSNIAFVQFVTSSSPSFDVNNLPTCTNDSVPTMVSRNLVTMVHQPEEPRNKVVPIAAAYYPAWSVASCAPNKLDFGKFDVIFFAFAMPDASSNLSWEPDSKETLKKLVSSARQSGKGTKIVLSVGGWAGSHWFSNSVKNAVSRTKFSDVLVGAVKTFGLDGIDIDWEYPNSTGAGNPHSPADAANFLALIKLLRASLGPSKIISAAVAHTPWLGANGKPLTNVSEYAALMTYVNIMNYDVCGASSKPGPNAPLGDLCGTSKQPQASAYGAFTQWTKAGFPAHKLLLGLALYGYVSKSTAKKLSGALIPNPSLDPTGHPRGPLKDLSTAPAGDLSTMWGQQIAFGQLVKMGVLKRKEDGHYDAANGLQFLFNVVRQTVVTYDDTWSIADKVKFAKKSGMAGCFTWSLDQDDGLALQNVIRLNLGKN